MLDSLSNLNDCIAEPVRELRGQKEFSLDTLAGKSRVSRSMISLIERGETSPTAVVLEKLAIALGVPLASMFDAPATQQPSPNGPVPRRKDQTLWKGSESGYVRRNVSPPDVSQPMQIVETMSINDSRHDLDVREDDLSGPEIVKPNSSDGALKGTPV